MRRISSCPNIAGMASSKKFAPRIRTVVSAFDMTASPFETFVEEVGFEAVYHVPAHVAHVCLLQNAREFPTSIMQIQRNGDREQVASLMNCVREPSECEEDQPNCPRAVRLGTDAMFIYDKSAFRSIRRRKSFNVRSK